MCVKRHRKCNL